MKKASKLFTLNQWDVIKAIALVFITTLLTGLYEVLTNADGFNIGHDGWVNILRTAVLTTLAYLVKNFLSGNQSLNDKI